MTRLPVIGTLQEALRMVADHRRDLLRVGLAFIIGLFALTIVFARYVWPMFPGTLGGTGSAQEPVDPRLPSALIIMLVLGILLLTVFAVGWHRAMLIGAERGQGAQLGRRELRYFGRFWLCIAISFAALLVVAFVEQFIGIALRLDPQSMTWGAVLTNLLVIAYVFGRLGPSFVALSVDRPMTFRESWMRTKGNGLRILLIYVLTVIGGLVLNLAIGLLLGLLGLGENAPYTVMLVGTLTLYVLVVVVVSTNIIVFRQLTGWKAAA